MAVKVEKKESIAILKLNRPKSYNAINMDMALRLSEELIAISDDPKIDGVIITGEGDAFCAGGDLRWIAEQGDDYYATFYSIVSEFHKAIKEIFCMEKPVVAVINGVASGGGLSLALCCDFRIMEKDAKLLFAYTSRGLSPDGGCSYMLPRIVGIAKALEIAAFDREISSEEALRIGLVTEVVEKGEGIKRAKEIINHINEKSPTFGTTKRLMYESFSSAFESHLENERKTISITSSLRYGKEGIRAFVEKRKPVYKKD